MKDVIKFTVVYLIFCLLFFLLTQKAHAYDFKICFIPSADIVKMDETALKQEIESQIMQFVIEANSGGEIEFHLYPLRTGIVLEIIIKEVKDEQSGRVI